MLTLHSGVIVRHLTFYFPEIDFHLGGYEGMSRLQFPSQMPLHLFQQTIHNCSYITVPDMTFHREEPTYYLLNSQSKNQIITSESQPHRETRVLSGDKSLSISLHEFHIVDRTPAGVYQQLLGNAAKCHCTPSSVTSIQTWIQI